MLEDLRRSLAAYEPDELIDDSLVPAGVLILVYQRDGEPHIVFQRRTDHVDAHKGEVSLPGGAVDEGDPDLQFTALRESHEEIGIHPDEVEVLGRLDDLRTISNFRIRPYVGWYTGDQPVFTFSAFEVAYLLEVPIAHLQDPANFREDRRVFGEREVILPSYTFNEDLIFGATARIVTNFLDVLQTDSA